MAYLRTGKPRGRKPGPNKKPLEVKPPEGRCRPIKPIDWKLVDTLLMSGCTGTEIASHFDMAAKSFYIRVEQQYGMTFTDYSSEKRSRGESLLRHKQFEVAMKGDKTMLVWLGKNRLGQKETEEKTTIAPNDTYLTAIIAELKSLKEKKDGPS
jgi:hypothetical protein